MNHGLTIVATTAVSINLLGIRRMDLHSEDRLGYPMAEERV